MNLRSLEIIEKEYYKLATPSEYLFNQIQQELDIDNKYSYNKNFIIYNMNSKLNRPFSSPNTYLLAFYDYMLGLKKTKHDNLWKNETLYLIDRMPQGRDLLIKYNVNIDNTKYSSYNMYALERVAEDIHTYFLKNFSNTTIFLDSPDYKHLENSFMTYYNSKFIKWNELLDSSPNILLANLAHNSGYELKPQEVKKIFNFCLSFMENPHLNSYGNIKLGNTENYSLLFAKIINESPFFEHTLINSKNIKLSVSKFLEAPKEFDKEKIKIFCESIINYPGFLKDNLDRKLLRRESLFLFNTLYPNNEQVEIIKQQKEKPKKKVKI